jgi:hypothetical protein
MKKELGLRDDLKRIEEVADLLLTKAPKDAV